jgi:hypothetical protein
MKRQFPTGSNNRPQTSRSLFSLRLTFAYDRTKAKAGIRLVEVERVRAVAPGIAMPPPGPKQSGAWFEVRDARSRLVYYQPLHDPIPETVEVFADAAGQPNLSRIPNKQMQGEFTALFPDVVEAVSFSFFASVESEPAGSKRGASAPGLAQFQPAQELAKFSLKELRRRATDGK